MAEWEFAASLSVLRKEEERMETLQQERRALVRQLEETTQRPTALNRLTELHLYFEIIDQRIREQHEGVRIASEQVTRRQSQLKDKMVDEKVWLNAKDRAYERFRTEWLNKEQSELDEIAIVRSAAVSRG